MSRIKVSELNKYIKKYISMDYLLSQISVEGEVSNFKHHSNGNFYFSLKDERARINTIMYREDAMDISFVPVDGMQIVATGTISFYESHGQMNFYVTSIEKLGEGNLYQQFLILKEQLEKKGYFLQSHKKILPKFPTNVGIITSDTGAAVQDIINVLHHKNNLINIIIYPALVQGPYAASSMIAGIEYFNSHPVDVIILGRGGGSFEDLFAFNDEKLAEAIYQSVIPIISAVGHEIDYSISDFVADARAATPTQAAEMVSISKEELVRQLQYSKIHMWETIYSKLESTKIDLMEIENFFKRLQFSNQIKGKENSLAVLGMQLREKISGRNQIEIKRLRKLSFCAQQIFQNSIYDKKNVLRNTIQNLSQIKYVLARKVSQQEKILHTFQGQLLSRRQILKIEEQNVRILKDDMVKALQWKLRENSNSLAHLYEQMKIFNQFFYGSLNVQIRSKNFQLSQIDLYQKIQEQKEKMEILRKEFAKEITAIAIPEKRRSFYVYEEKMTTSVVSKIQNEKRTLEILKLKLFHLYQNMNRIQVFFEDGTEVTKLMDLSKNDPLKILFKDGFAHVIVNDIEQLR